VQKISQDVAWLGFPKSALKKIEDVAKANNWTFEQKSPDHITIDGIPQTSGYEKWWANIIKTKPEPVKDDATKSKNKILPAYKASYDLCLHVYSATTKISKEYRYEIGARIRSYATDIVEILHLANNISSYPKSTLNCANIIHKLRIDLRILKDLKQINIESWGFLNRQIENLLDLLRAEFCNSRIAGETLSQSSNSLPTAVQRSS
jgi:hypothetical protein